MSIFYAYCSRERVKLFEILVILPCLACVSVCDVHVRAIVCFRSLTSEHLQSITRTRSKHTKNIPLKRLQRMYGFSPSAPNALASPIVVWFVCVFFFRKEISRFFFSLAPPCSFVPLFNFEYCKRVVQSHIYRCSRRCFLLRSHSANALQPF